jgi:hypothetical protein
LKHPITRIVYDRQEENKLQVERPILEQRIANTNTTMLTQRNAGLTRTRSSESMQKARPQPALGRRRGATSTARGGKNGGFLYSCFGALCLLGVGLVVGAVVGVALVGGPHGGRLPFLVRGDSVVVGGSATIGAAAAAADSPPKVVGVDALLRRGAGALQKRKLVDNNDNQNNNNNWAT